MACVRKRRNKWVLDYRDQYGRRHWETIDGNRKEADQLLAQRLHEVGRGDYCAPDEQKTFDQLVEAFRAGHIRVAVRDTTAKWYEGAIRNHLLPYFEARKIREIAVVHIEHYRASLIEKGVGRRTVKISV